LSASKAAVIPSSAPASFDPLAVRNTTSWPSTTKFTGKTTTSPPATNPTRPTETAASSRRQESNGSTSSPA
jgi:hypothetical protein